LATLQQKIADEVIAKLQKAAEFDDVKLKRLQELMRSGKRVQAEDLVKIFSTPCGGDLR
jgi:hypothetical protein